jgi:magnesium transporter
VKLGSSVLAHFVLNEQLEKLGVLGCVSCIVGSVVVVMHAPEEHMPNSVEGIWNLATQPGEESMVSNCTSTHFNCY